MAAVSQPGSRAGLITALVIFVILFFIAAILAVVKSADLKEQEQRMEALQKKYDFVVKNADLPTLKGEVEAIRRQPGMASITYYDYAKAQIASLATAISGRPDMGSTEAVNASTGAINAINRQLNAKPIEVTVPGGSGLISAMQVLADAIAKRQVRADDLDAKLASAMEEMKKREEIHKTDLDKLKAEVAAAKEETLAVTKERDKYREGKEADYKSVEAKVQKEIEEAKKVNEELATQVTGLTQDKEKYIKENKKLVETIAKWRPKNLAESAIRRPDGKIIQVNKNNVVYINLGQGQQISRGMTFEIYDKNEGVPKGEGGPDDSLPAGKASLEVVSVGPGSSECRVIRLRPGQQVFEGDLIANLIYDPNVKWSFRVFGDFDVDSDSKATPAEADIIKRLVVEWGGRLSDRVNIDTDFVVLGKEPVLPNYSKEELNDPWKKFERDKAEEALKAYDAVKNAAIELHIPVLNQNRFLYMIGFYDQGKK